MTNPTSSEAFFEAKYREAVDPWAFAVSPYEQSRYAAILSALAGHRFERAFEPGCSIGILTERLAAICDRVEAIDISATAVSRARERCRHLHNVTISHAALPEGLPTGSFDLVVFSEIGYYFEPAALTELCQSLIRKITTGGVLLAVHWLGCSVDHILSGDRVHDILGSLPALILKASQRHEGFRIDRWRCA